MPHSSDDEVIKKYKREYARVNGRDVVLCQYLYGWIKLITKDARGAIHKQNLRLSSLQQMADDLAKRDLF